MAMSMVMFVWFSSFFLVALLLAFLVYQVSIYTYFTFQVYLQLMIAQGTDRQSAVDSRSTLVYVWFWVSRQCGSHKLLEVLLSGDSGGSRLEIAYTIAKSDYSLFHGVVWWLGWRFFFISYPNFCVWIAGDHRFWWWKSSNRLPDIAWSWLKP